MGGSVLDPFVLLGIHLRLMVYPILLTSDCFLMDEGRFYPWSVYFTSSRVLWIRNLMSL